jgi:hypothetical protein
MSLVLWSVFVFVQTIKHRDYFLDAPSDEDLPMPWTTLPAFWSRS